MVMLIVNLALADCWAWNGVAANYCNTYPNQGDTNRVIGRAKTKKVHRNIEYNIFEAMRPGFRLKVLFSIIKKNDVRFIP